jgi:hypothetical protein
MATEVTIYETTNTGVGVYETTQTVVTVNQGISGIVSVDSGELTNTGTSSAAVLGLATAGTAGTYTKVTTDTFGRVISGTTLSAGDVPTLNQNTTGNAATATALATARNINGVSFNGTADITVADATKAPLTGATFTGAITATDITDSTITTAGVVTNTSAGLFGTTAILPATTGGTGVGFPDRILIAKGAQNTTVTGSATGGTMTSAFGAVTPQYVTLEASSTYFFDAYLPIAKASSTVSGQWQVSVMYLDASSGATISPTSMVVTAQVWSTTASETGATIVATNTATSLGTATTSAVTRYLRVNGTIVTSSTVPKISVGFGQSQNALSGSPTTNNNSISVYKLTSATTLGGAWQS